MVSERSDAIKWDKRRGRIFSTGNPFIYVVSIGKKMCIYNAPLERKEKRGRKKREGAYDIFQQLVKLQLISPTSSYATFLFDENVFSNEALIPFRIDSPT